jgi:SagB-type dehydrogenase family enzyme
MTPASQEEVQADGHLRIRRGLAVVPCNDGVVFAGGVWGKKIAGKDAHKILLPIARLLNGSSSISEITTKSGFADAAVRQVISTLARQGLLESVNDAAEGTTSAALAAYLAKTFNPAGPHRTVAATLAAMSEAMAVVMAPAELADRICTDLSASGIGMVAAGTERADAALVGSRKASRALALVHDDGSDRVAQMIAELLSGKHGSCLPVLRFNISQLAIEVGPTYYPGSPPTEQACHDCMRMGRRRLWDTDAAITSPGIIDVGCALVATEAIAALSDLGTITSFRTLNRLVWPELTAERYVVLPEPTCPACASDSRYAGRSDPAPELFDAYELEVQLRPACVPQLDSPSAARQRTLELRQSMRTFYPGSPRIALPEGDGLPSARRSNATAGDASLNVMADILRRTAGKRNPSQATDIRRWTASGGNLASVELYVISNSELCGWTAGTVFKYDDETHELVVTTREATAWRPADTGGRTADFTVIFVGAFDRVGEKYGAFSLRLSLLDAGCALAQLNVLAALHGLQLTVSTSWDSSLPAAIELAEQEEIITAIAQLHWNEAPHAADQRDVR